MEREVMKNDREVMKNDDARFLWVVFAVFCAIGFMYVMERTVEYEEI